VKTRTKVLLTAAGAGIVTGVILYSRRHPCPAWLAGWLENPLAAMMPPSLDRLELSPGMRVLDVGSGPGRLTIPMAKAVAPGGEVVALDLQMKMLERLTRRADREGAANIRAVHGNIVEAGVEPESFDRAVLATVLGEINDRERALREIASALRPGGVLSITEIIGDPHRLSRETVRRLAESAGLLLRNEFGGRLAFTLNFEKPRA
jgi:SAM-dependent methyltransferase